MAWGNRIELERLQMCEACGYAACVCAFMAKHPEGCQRRRAVLDTHPEPCAAHGTYACEVCWPCDCGAVAAPAARSAAAE
jgi:hypothetical protein